MMEKRRKRFDKSSATLERAQRLMKRVGVALIETRTIAQDLLGVIELERSRAEAELARTTNKQRRAYLKGVIRRHVAMVAEAHQYLGTPAKGGRRN
jgi:multidrug resistance efflux pump